MAALEAGTGALRALELAVAARPEDSAEVEERRRHLEHATELLQDAISELRAYQSEEPAPGAAGFVMAVKRRRMRDKQSGEDAPRD